MYFYASKNNTILFILKSVHNVEFVHNVESVFENFQIAEKYST